MPCRASQHVLKSYFLPMFIKNTIATRCNELQAGLDFMAGI
jgi:hypothetical protein